ncbi:tautomerase family protein [Sphingobacterium suaedae]|uniref:4-oxalocrotonate tautomerase family protein n=1 Tax=Sphingobacterium suaedae TaxID=1686402 RepID=A0ABW5KK07_9SPHI
MPSIKITTASLNEEAKTDLVKSITASVHSATQIPVEYIHVIFDIVGDDNYAVGGQTVREIKMLSTKKQ